MFFRKLFIACIASAAFTFGAEAQLRTGWVTEDLNMRASDSVRSPVIVVIPGGARIDVFGCPSWCRVAWAGYEGWAHPRYVAFAPRGPRYARRGPPPYSPYGTARWDPYYDTWYDGRYWWHDGGWRPRPRHGIGIYFRFP